ncbi:hypothetical protein [Candidatus Poriferisodalis sp.]|uniref:hypothetical protein n=1 Tax=Candidatus Poriferisodalis sp. TaxID=3101277 RepID=UPI003B021EE6
MNEAEGRSGRRRRRWRIAGLSILGLVILAAAIGALTDESEDSTPATDDRRPVPTATTVRPDTQRSSPFPDTAAEAFEPCVSAWDGNHEGFEALIRGVLNDPGSMETHGTYYNSSDSTSDGTILIRLNYGARNAFGGMVRVDARGLMDVRTCEIVEVISYGFE